MEPSEWYWEGHVQDRVQDHLIREGWMLLSSADTASQETGVDLVMERDGQRLNIEVKGWPSTTYRRGPKAGQPKPTNPTVQARHWFAGALLSAALLRDAQPDARIALAFPDFPRYRKLLARTASPFDALDLEVLLVEEDGSVDWTDPRQLKAALSSPPRSQSPSHPATPTVQSDHDLTLHEAMALVLRETVDQRLPAVELAAAINQRGLYRMRDGRPVAPGQIHARARNYAHLFTSGDGAAGLRR